MFRPRLSQNTTLKAVNGQNAQRNGLDQTNEYWTSYREIEFGNFLHTAFMIRKQPRILDLLVLGKLFSESVLTEIWF